MCTIIVLHTCKSSMVPSGNVECTQVVVNVAKDFKAKGMSHDNVWTFSGNGHVCTLYWEFTVVSVMNLHALRGDLGHALDTSVRVDLGKITVIECVVLDSCI